MHLLKDNGKPSRPQQPKRDYRMQLDNGVAVGKIACYLHRGQCIYGKVEFLRSGVIDRFRPNVVMTTLDEESERTFSCYGAFVKPLDRNFYEYRQRFIERELETLESAWKLREQLLQNLPQQPRDRTKRDYRIQLDNGVTVGRIACCRGPEGRINYGEVKFFRSGADRFRPNVVLEDISSGYQFSRYGGVLQPLDRDFYQYRKRFLEREMEALDKAWQARNSLDGLVKNGVQLLAIALQVRVDESRSVESHYSCVSLEDPALQVRGGNALDALDKWMKAYATQPQQLRQFYQFYKNSPDAVFSGATDYVCIDLNTPSRWCYDSDPFCAIGKWVSLYSKHSGLDLLQSFQTRDSSPTTLAGKL